VAARIRPTYEVTSAALTDTLWKAAGKLRGTTDASEYRTFVLALIFLKSASAPGGRSAIRVPPSARWDAIATAVTGESGIGAVLDAAMAAIGAANPALAAALPHDVFGGRGVDERRLGELVRVIDGLDVRDRRRPGAARDVLGEVYEYCLEKFAHADGRRGGEYYTPKSVVELIVAMLEPRPGERVYDPACGSGGMFVQAERFIETHGGGTGISVYGQELNRTTWRLAAMNLAIHGIAADLGARPADSLHDDLHPGLRADVVMANPPFNISDWGGDRLRSDPRWAYGVPPEGNANFAWLQLVADRLAVRGRAGVVLANGSMSSRQSGEGEIRWAMVEHDLVACVVALPGRLFRSTQIPACLWLLSRYKPAERSGQILLVDGRELGRMIARTERELTCDDIGRIASTYHAWCGARSNVGYADVPGFCRSVGRAEVAAHDFVLTPSRYVGTAVPGDDGDADATLEQIRDRLLAQFETSAALATEVGERLRRIDGRIDD
jgi:type I restriction enzyme M protein